jgi:DNA-binding CsgD family transcriptional regulator
MKSRRLDPVAAVEAAYSLEGDDREWLQAISELVAPVVDGGDGILSYLYDTRTAADGWLANSLKTRVSAEFADFLEVTARFFRAPDAAINRVHTTTPLFAAMSEVSHRPEFAGFFATLRSQGFADSVALRTSDGSGCGLVINSLWREPASIGSRAARIWTQVSTHLAAGLRLRRAAKTDGDLSEAVLRPDGRIEDAKGDAKPKVARELLRDAVLRQEKARGRTRRDDPEAALELWRGLEYGRWSLVDHFERGGRRYLVARRNAVEFADPRGLTPRERQVVQLAALGHASKLIAYELGLSTSTVGSQLASAVRKLGLRDRLDLIRFWHRSAP